MDEKNRRLPKITTIIGLICILMEVGWDFFDLATHVQDEPISYPYTVLFLGAFFAGILLSFIGTLLWARHFSKSRQLRAGCVLFGAGVLTATISSINIDYPTVFYISPLLSDVSVMTWAAWILGLILAVKGMNGFIRRHRKLSAVVLSLASLFVVLLSAEIRGGLVASFDLARGHYEVLGFGLPAPWFSEYTRLLRERYGIEERSVAGCIVYGSLVAYADGYNTVSMRAANYKFGRDVFQESNADARKSWETQQPQR